MPISPRLSLALALVAAACADPDPGATSTGEDGSSSGDPCPVGSPDCPCTPGGGCDPGLECADGMCAEPIKTPLCGDMVVDEGEACDDGNDIAGDGCGPGCTVDACGNDVVEASKGEECEPGVEPEGECTAACLDARKVMFVSSQMWKGGEIGGVSGGDEKCQALASEAGLPGEFKAWLATSEDDAPLVRFAWADVPYVDTAGVVLAESWMLIYNSEGRPPRLTEFGETAPEAEFSYPATGERTLAWASGLEHAGGPKADPVSCSGWSSTIGNGPTARLDVVTFANVWSGADCGLRAPIICTEQ